MNIDHDHHRQQCDPLGDALIARLFERGHLDDASRILHDLMFRDDPGVLDEVPPAIDEYLRVTRTLPPWAEPERIRRAQDLFVTYGGISFASLICASLPECYVDWRAALVLGETRRLELGPIRRVLETAQFVIDVMKPGELRGGQPPGVGVRAIQRVRLMHAAIRYLVEHERHDHLVGAVPGNHDFFMDVHWDSSRLGRPINQIDLAYTLLTFGVVTLRSWRLTGLEVTARDAEDFIHCWAVIGYLLGIDEALIPRTPPRAETMFRSLRGALSGRSDHGVLLAHAAADTMARLLSSRIGMLSGVAESMALMLMRQLVEADGVETLALRDLSRFERRVGWPLMRATELTFGFLFNVSRGIEPLDRLKWHLGHLTIRIAGHASVRIQDRLFELPTHLGPGEGEPLPGRPGAPP